MTKRHRQSLAENSILFEELDYVFLRDHDFLSSVIIEVDHMEGVLVHQGKGVSIK